MSLVIMIHRMLYYKIPFWRVRLKLSILGA